MNTTPEPESPAEGRAGSWSRYWSSGALHSCAGTFTGNYGGEVKAFWRRALGGLPAGGQLLDLCTGNGALPQLMLDLLGDASTVRVDAVDMARIDPDWVAALDPSRRARLRFHPQTPVERIPLADRSVDLAVSQFGFEYTRLPDALPELRRLLRPGARVALIVHATDSLIARLARTDLEHLAWIRESPLLELAAGMCEPMSRVGSAAGRESLRVDADANALRARFNQAMQALAARGETADTPDLLVELLQSLAAIMDGCARSGDAASGRTALAELVQGLQDHALRQRELLDCARDQQQAAALLEPIGARIDPVEPIRFDNGELLGWGVTARV